MRNLGLRRIHCLCTLLDNFDFHEISFLFDTSYAWNQLLTIFFLSSILAAWKDPEHTSYYDTNLQFVKTRIKNVAFTS